MADSCHCRQNPLQCCEVISLQLIKINEKKKERCPQKTYSFQGKELVFHSLSVRERKRQMRIHVIEGKYVFCQHQRFSSWAEGLACLNDGNRSYQRWNSSRVLINGAMKTCRLCRSKMTDSSLSHLEMVGQSPMLQKQVDANISKDWPLPLSRAKHTGQLCMVFKPFTIYEI